MNCNIRTVVQSLPETRQSLQQVRHCLIDLLTRVIVLEGTPASGSGAGSIAAIPPTTSAGAPIKRLTLLADTNKAQQYSLRPAITSAATAAAGELIRCDTDGGAFTVTLPAIDTHTHGDEIVIKNTGSSANDVTVAPTGSDTIDGSGSVAVVDGIVATFVSDGSATWVQV